MHIEGTKGYYSIVVVGRVLQGGSDREGSGGYGGRGYEGCGRVRSWL